MPEEVHTIMVVPSDLLTADATLDHPFTTEYRNFLYNGSPKLEQLTMPEEVHTIIL